jgi:hypothetical protein
LGFGGGRRGGIGRQKMFRKKTRGIWRSLLCFRWKAGRQGLFGLMMTAAFVDFEICSKKLDYQNLVVIEVSKFGSNR